MGSDKLQMEIIVLFCNFYQWLTDKWWIVWAQIHYFLVEKPFPACFTHCICSNNIYISLRSAHWGGLDTNCTSSFHHIRLKCFLLTTYMQRSCTKTLKLNVKILVIKTTTYQVSLLAAKVIDSSCSVKS